MENKGYYLSASQIKSFMSCPLRYRFRYKNKLAPDFISAALIFGSCMHRAFSAYCEGCAHIGDLMSIFKREWEMSQDGPALIRFSKTDSPETQEPLAERMLLALMKDWQPREIEAVDYEVEGNIAGFDVVGVLDAISGENGRKIIEFKTAARAGTFDNTVQLGTYSLLTSIEQVEVVEVTKTANPVVSVDEIDGKKLWKRTEAIYRYIGNAIGDGGYYPSPSWHCQGCGHRGACERWGENGTEK